MRDTLHILDHGRLLPLEYESLLMYHGGGSLAGAAIGYCAMAAAGRALSARKTWDRRDLSVRSWHAGPGILDAIEFVTRAISRQHFERVEAARGNCGELSAFHFEVSDGARRVELQLQDGVVAPAFFELAGVARRTPVQDLELARLKGEVADAVMAVPLEQLFSITAGTAHA